MLSVTDTNVPSSTVSILSEIPEQLHEVALDFLETHQGWDQNRLATAALSMFLLQKGGSTPPPELTNIYWSTLEAKTEQVA